MYRTSTTIASVFGLTAFAVSVIAGLSAGVPASTILLRALIAMVVCYAVGRFAGHIGEHVASDFVRSYTAAKPIPADPSSLVSGGGGAGAAPTSAGDTDVAEVNP